MMHGPELHWLPRQATWSQALAACTPGAEAWPNLCALARARIDALETRTLDRRRLQLVPEPPANLVSPPIRLAVLASSTVDHLLPAIRVGGLRRDLWIDIHTPDYGQYTQALMDPGVGIACVSGRPRCCSRSTRIICWPASNPAAIRPRSSSASPASVRTSPRNGPAPGRRFSARCIQQTCFRCFPRCSAATSIGCQAPRTGLSSD